MELIIKNKNDKRTRSSVVINIEMETRSEIDRLALASGHSFNEIVEMLLEFALPHCKLADDGKATTTSAPEPATITPATRTTTAPAIKANTVSTSAAKSTVKTVTVPKTVTTPKTATAPKTVTASKTVAAPKSAVKLEPLAVADEKPSTSKTKSSASGAHSAVPTFKLPPITASKTATKSKTPLKK